MKVVNLVVLAAGKGTRLKVSTPKPLLKVLGKTLVERVLTNFSLFEKDHCSVKMSVIVGHQRELIESQLSKISKEIEVIVQEQQLGTGHAVQEYIKQSQFVNGSDYVCIVNADTPLITSDHLKELYTEIDQNKYHAVAASFNARNPFGLGRIVSSEEGFIIVEEKDTNENQRKINEVNSGFYLIETSYLKERIFSLNTNNAQGEFYLTDLFKLGERVKAINFGETLAFEGINDLVQLGDIEKQIQRNILCCLMRSGVRVINPDSVYIEDSVEVEPEVVIGPGVCLYGKTKIETKTTLESGVIVKNSTIGKGNTILANTYIEDSTIHNETNIGPMARVRPGCVISDKVKIGNFVELKKAYLSQGAKVSHLSYLGDATVGTNTNIGCGFVTCNYDGKQKHQTVIGDNSFIGSDCQVVAPINIGDGVYVASGSTINKDIPSEAFAIARSRQVTKPDMAKRFK